MKRHIPYFSFYPADFMNGVRGLNATEVGVYTMLLCRIYEESGPVEYNALRLSTYCGMREQTFIKSVQRLVDLGKLSICDGMLSNARAEVEIAKRARDLENSSKAGKASAEKRQEKQRNGTTDVQQTFNHTDTDTDTDTYGGGGVAREAEKTDREAILEAIGVDPVSGITGPSGKQLGTQADMAEVARWLDLPGITVPVILTEVRRIMAGKRDGPPSTFRFFTKAIQRLSGEISRPALDPITPQPTNGGRHDRQRFDQTINAIADGLSAGTVQLDTQSRDPFAARPGGNA